MKKGYRTSKKLTKAQQTQKKLYELVNDSKLMLESIQHITCFTVVGNDDNEGIPIMMNNGKKMAHFFISMKDAQSYLDHIHKNSSDKSSYKIKATNINSVLETIKNLKNKNVLGLINNSTEESSNYSTLTQSDDDILREEVRKSLKDLSHDHDDSGSCCHGNNTLEKIMEPDTKNIIQKNNKEAI